MTLPNNYSSHDDLQPVRKQSWVQMPLPSRHDLGRFMLWASGRTCIGILQVGNIVIRATLQNLVALTNIVDMGLNALLTVYNALPFMGAPLLTLEAGNGKGKALLADVTSVDLLSSITGKHVLIVGDTGSGKSTIAQYIAHANSTTTKVYDPDAAPTEWQGLQVIGRGGDFDSIDIAMASDLLEMQDRITARATHGDSANAGKDLCIIAEEFPLLKDECSMAGEWMGKIARRGRKPRMLLCILSQSDTVQALGIEGDGAIRSNFRYLRLGRFALAHAAKLKNDALTQWLKAGQYRCLVDDDPCQLPDMKATRMLTHPVLLPPHTQQSLPAETPMPQGLQPQNAHMEGGLPLLKVAVRSLKDSGWSDTKIIEEVLGCTGRRFAEGKQRLAALLSE